MTFQPTINQELDIDGVTWRIAEHPSAPGMPYGQEGRQASVYQLLGSEGKRALKVFKARYRTPSLVSLADKLAPFSGLPGLFVCLRRVITSRHTKLLREHPDLAYAVLMSWIDGPTWLELVLDKRAFSPEQSLHFARVFAGLLAQMEEQGIAHCDLSGANMLLPGLASSLSPEQHPIELVDLEQLYGPNLDRPASLPGGSHGYAHSSASAGLWQPQADRFSGALLLVEMLGWCDERVRNAAWGESYFSPEDMQHETARYWLLRAVLSARWGESVSHLFERAWRSDTLADCPTLGEWLVMLPDEVPEPASLDEALLAAHAAPPVSTRSSGQQEISSEPPAQDEQIITGGSYTLPPEDRSLVENSVIASTVAHHSVQNTDVDTLFDEGRAAYERKDWTRARELLGEVIRRQPHYRQGKYQAAQLLADADQQVHAGENVIGSKSKGAGWVKVAVPALLVCLLVVFGVATIFQMQPTRTSQEQQATATAQAQRIQDTASTTVADQPPTSSPSQGSQSGTAQAMATATTLAKDLSATKDAQASATTDAQATEDARATEMAIEARETTTTIANLTATAIAQPPTSVTEDSILARIKNRGYLIAGVKYDVRIFGYLNPETNQVEGFDVDLAKAVAERIFGSPDAIQFEEAISRNRIPYLDDGRVDVIFSTMTANATRAEQIDFSDAYFIAGQSLLVPVNSDITSVTDLSGKRVGTAKGSTSELNIRAFAPDAQIELFDAYAQAVAAMDAGRLDAVTTDDIILYGFERNSPDKFKVVGGQFTQEPYAAGVKKGNTELLEEVNATIRELKESGEWAAIYKKWTGIDPNTIPPQDWVDVYEQAPIIPTIAP